MTALALAGVIGVARLCVADKKPLTRSSVKHQGSASVVAKGSAVPSTRGNPGDEVGALRLEGQVIDDAQQPIAGARVVLDMDLIATTGGDGSFVFEKLAAKRYSVGAYKDELYAPLQSVRLTDAIEPVILRMRRGATLVVHVNGESGPVAGARVARHGTEAVAGADGVARLAGLGSRFHYVEVTAQGYAPTAFSMMLSEDPGGTIEHTVTLRRGAAVSGIVVGPDGKPVPDATVEINGLSGDPSQDRWSGRAKSDSSGAWKLEALAADKYQLRASSKNYGPAARLIVEVDGVTPQSDVVVRVEYGAQIVGTVVDVAGKPVSDCVTHASGPMSQSYDERSDATGRFEILGVAAGEYDVYCISGSLSSPSVRVSVANDERVELRLVVDEGSIAGVVVDSKGAPVPGAHVSALPTERFLTANFGGDTTDSRGRFDLGGLPPGEYDVSATWPDQDEWRLGNRERIQTGSKNVRLVLATPATITGRALLDGKPMPYYGVAVTEKPQNPYLAGPTGVRSPDGRFTVRGIEPGVWNVVLVGPGTARKIIANVKVEAGKVTALGDIPMARGQRISGRVLDTAGRPVAGARVEIGGAADTSKTSLQRWFVGRFATVSDESGAYAFDGIAPVGGKQRATRIAASHESLGASVPAELPQGDAVIDLILAPTGAIDGIIEGSSTHPIVIAKRANDAHAFWMEHANGAGEFRFEALPPGNYRVSLGAAPGMVGASTTVTVIANQRARATITVGTKRILLTVKVVGGSCQAIILAPAEADPAEVKDVVGFQPCSQAKAEFEVPPGNYHACPDGKGCVPVTVAESPVTQAIEIRPSSN